MNEKNEKLEKIEMELAQYVKTDQKNWIRIYQLMRQVEEEKLYAECKDTPSYTAWVNALADKLHVHVSLLWARLKAGKNYEEYERRAKRNGRSVVPLEDVVISPDSINLCERVAGKNGTEMDCLIDKVVKENLTREDLRAAAKAKRLRGEKFSTSRYNRVNEQEREEGNTKIDASAIVLALRKPTWLSIRRDDPYFEHIYCCFAEFRAENGSSRHTRRLDILVAETITVDDRDKITFRGIEIKIDKKDLLTDCKMQEYTEFVDYFYIAIPANDVMIEAARSIRLPEWGILTVDNSGNITVMEEPRQLYPVYRDRTMANCIIKMAKQ